MTISEGRLTYDAPDGFVSGPIPSAASIGTFDGLHRGHQLVISTLTAAAADRRLRPLVFSFDRHPLSVIDPRRAPSILMRPERRDRKLAELGVLPLCVHFTPEIQHLSSKEWMRILRDIFGVRLLVIGYDNTFGSDGRHISHAELCANALQLGIEPIDSPKHEGASSSKARKAIAAGDVSAASRILGYPYTLYGTVVKGEQIGRTIGFPTANLVPEPGSAIPANGVYASLAVLPDRTEFPAMVNIGSRPTVGDGLSPTIEANIIDFSGNLYGKPLAIRFMKRLRDEQKFPDLAQLKSQLEKDRTQTLLLFGI